jgi:hypothetical protein
LQRSVGDTSELVVGREVNGSQKMGGIAALGMAATFVVGIVVFAGVLMPAGYFGADAGPAQKAAILADNAFVVTASYLVSFVLFGVFLVVMAVALHDRLRTNATAIAHTATVFGLIWAGLVIASGMVAAVGISRIVALNGSDPAQAGALWSALDLVVNGLGGELEIVGGLWVLLISWAALRAAGLPRPLGYVGIVVGAAGILTIIPGIEPIVFGLGLIVWFVWSGIALLRDDSADRTRALGAEAQRGR